MKLGIFLVGLLVSIQGWAAPFVVPSLEPLRMETPAQVTRDVPYLYHWTSVESLKRLAQGSRQRVFPFKKIIDPRSMIVTSFPELSGKPGLFAWSNPVGGIGASEQEMYASEKDPALIRLQMKPNLRILILESLDGVRSNAKIKLDQVDVIFHSRQFRFHEFVIVNPAAIVGFTADPQALGADFDHWIPWFRELPKKTPNETEQSYVTGDLFVEFGRLSSGFERLVLPRIQVFLKSARKIPPLFLSER